MKCGREIPDGVFCPDCLAAMAKYPVKPNTVVLIPNRQKFLDAKRSQPRRKELTEQEQLQRARKKNRVLGWVCAVLGILLAAFITFSLFEYEKAKPFPAGQNYSTVPTTLPESDVSRETSEPKNG